jgi:hypothetical protein
MKFLALILLSWNLEASEEVVRSMVPKGKILEKLIRTYTVKTRAGSKVEIRLQRDGKFWSALGRNLNQGDEFEPGDGLISLGTAAQALEVLGKTPKGAWVLEKDEKLGWIYEIETRLVDAKSGRLLNLTQ